MKTREKLDQMKASEAKNAAAEARQAEEQRMAAEARRRGLSWKQRQVHALNFRYGLQVAKWQAEAHTDERDVFVRRFDAMIRGVKSLPANPEMYVRTAVEEKLRRDMLELDRIERMIERGRRRDTGGDQKKR